MTPDLPAPTVPPERDPRGLPGALGSFATGVGS
jgi:hypothetical protein